MKRMWICIALLFLLSLPITAKESQEEEALEPPGTYLKIGCFSWTEYVGNKMFIQDRTMLITAGMEGTLPLSKNAYELSWLVEANGGVGFYDGSYILSKKPKKSLEMYVGTREELMTHKHVVKRDRFQAGLFLGLGHTFFIKEPEDEIWNVLYARAGIETTFKISDTKVFMKYGAMLPMATIVYGSHLNIGYEDGFYYPRSHISVFGELGCLLQDGTKVSLALDSLQLGRSSNVMSRKLFDGNIQPFYQPELKSYTIWLKVSYQFGHK